MLQLSNLLQTNRMFLAQLSDPKSSADQQKINTIVIKCKLDVRASCSNSCTSFLDEIEESAELSWFGPSSYVTVTIINTKKTKKNTIIRKWKTTLMMKILASCMAVEEGKQ